MNESVIDICTQIFFQEGALKYCVTYQCRHYKIITFNGLSILVFSGTGTFKEFIDNFRFYALTEEGFPIGWYLLYKSAFEKIKELSIELDFVAGFSRGGAAALIYSYYTDVECIAFSPPKVCSTIRVWEKPPLIIFSADDIITKLPLGFYGPANYCIRQLKTGGHFFKKDKYKLSNGTSEELPS